MGKSKREFIMEERIAGGSKTKVAALQKGETAKVK